MEVQILPIKREEAPILHNLMQFYIYEFSEYLQDIKLEKDGRFEPFKLDGYWIEPHLKPLFIKVDKQLAGFVLLEATSDSSPNAVNEFFVLKPFTRKGVGRKAAFEVFKRWHGNWVVAQLKENKPAQAFWKKVIHEYTNGHFEELEDHEKRTIQSFTL
ncbi:GNAT family N-acetyltransferase [Alkalicoccobacillus plakortidis]|uniref:GNAT family N-acetyltransferase n=1 Tax=Alkalicoccobacillus plakortidis TaxID=444060 RepID=A0ABT0XJH5_9BACI|nr:GNAT family N-acetyltransferase [Alkalicoccobacillus plakortidis]MCM2676052.1 GNAT family N-acetyltransferase [Alkalicoccobacillus plakortidis]